MTLLWHEAAVAELEAAVFYYESIDVELGERLLNAAEVTVAEIKTRPEMPREFAGGIRKARLKRFPYAMVYKATGDSLLIIAFMHLHREPGYWSQRTQ